MGRHEGISRIRRSPVVPGRVMNLPLLLLKGWQRLMQVGPGALLLDIARRMHHRDGLDPFDQVHGTDTARRVYLWQCRIPYATARFGFLYLSCSEARTVQALQHIPRHCTFVDLGCGKGRTLIIAAEQGFTRIIGVEFAPALATIARENLALTQTIAQVIDADAMVWPLPAGPLCIYLYNPFTIEVLAPVVHQLAQRTEETWVVFMNPVGAPPQIVEALECSLVRKVVDVEQNYLVLRKADG